MSAAPTYRELLVHHVNFRRVWLGEVVSFLGDWFSLIALYTVVQELTDSKLALAGVLVGKTLPIFLVTPVAGPLVDRVDRRLLMIATDMARAALVLGLIAAWAFRSLPLLYLSLALQMAFAGIFIPARTAVIGQITNDRELPVAMALSGGTWSIMLAFGAALGGLLTSLVGIYGALLLDGLTYLVSAAFLWGLPALPPGDATSKESGSFAEGLRYLQGTPWLMTILLLKPLMAVQAAALVMLPVFGNGVFPLAAGPVFVGLLYSARGFGALVGSMGVRRLTGDSEEALVAAIPVAFLGASVCYLLVSWAPNIAWALLGFFGAALGTGTIWVFTGTLAQRASDDAFRGRVFALEWGAMTLVSALAAAGAGAVSDRFGLEPRQIVAATALYLALPGLVWPLVARRTTPWGTTLESAQARP